MFFLFRDRERNIMCVLCLHVCEVLHLHINVSVCIKCSSTDCLLDVHLSLFFLLTMLTDSFHSHLAINWHSPPLWKETEKKRGEISQAGGSEGCGKGACCCQSVCLPRPCPLPPRAACPPTAVISWLSSGKEMAKQGTVYLCRLYSLHIPAAGLRHHSNLPGSAKKGPADLLSTAVCIEVPGVQINRRQCPCSVRHCTPDNHTSPLQCPPNSVLSTFCMVHAYVSLN